MKQTPAVSIQKEKISEPKGSLDLDKTKKLQADDFPAASIKQESAKDDKQSSQKTDRK